MNRKHFGLFPALIAACAMALAPMWASAVTSVPKHARALFLQGVADATSTTFATTAYADLTGATVNVIPVVDPNTTDAASGVRTKYLKVTLTLTMSKATSTTGTCGVYVNGAVLAKTEQTITTANLNPNVSAVWLLPNTTSGTQTVKVQCKSGDTAVLTVSAGHLVVEEYV